MASKVGLQTGRGLRLADLLIKGAERVKMVKRIAVSKMRRDDRMLTIYGRLESQAGNVDT